MKLIYVGQDVSKYSSRLVDSLNRSAVNRGEGSAYESYISSRAANEANVVERIRDFDALIVDLHSENASSASLESQKELVEKFTAVGVPVVVLYAVDSQYDIAEQMVLSARALVIKKPTVTPSPDHFDKQTGRSVLTLIDAWRATRSQADAEIAGLPLRRSTTSGLKNEGNNSLIFPLGPQG